MRRSQHFGHFVPSAHSFYSQVPMYWAEHRTVAEWQSLHPLISRLCANTSLQTCLYKELCQLVQHFGVGICHMPVTIHLHSV